MTNECKTSEKQSALIHPNKSFYAPLRLLVAAFRWKPGTYSVVAFAVGYETSLCALDESRLRREQFYVMLRDNEHNQFWQINKMIVKSLVETTRTRKEINSSFPLRIY